LAVTQDIVLYNLVNNPIFFIEELLWIKTKKSELVPLKLNEEQLKIYNAIDGERKKNKPVRVLVLKCRQFGGTTLSEALVFQDTSTHSNRDSLIIAHNIESTNHIFRMSKLFYDKLDSNTYKPMVSSTNRKEIIFENPNKKDRTKNPGLRSSIRVDTAGNIHAGHSYTFQNLHISELGLWENPDDVMIGLLQAVPEEPNTMIIIESTANGMGNYFYDICQDAIHGKNDFVFIFIPWWEVGEYTRKAPRDFTLYDYDHPNYDNEVRIQKRFNLTLDQMCWRRHKIKNYCKNDLKKFQQEYPADYIEAFITTGSHVFDLEIIKDYSELVKNVEPVRGEFRWLDNEDLSDIKDSEAKNAQMRNGVQFLPRGNGRWLIWQFPQDDDKYAMGCDVAEGLADGNYSAAEIISRKNIAQVAEFVDHIKPEIYSDELAKAGHFYNDALIAVEANNHGLTTLTHLRPIYPFIYYERDFTDKTLKPRDRMGWMTTRKTKVLMIDKLDKNMRNRDIVIMSRELLDEMTKYVEKSDGSMGADQKATDDRIMAFAIANMVVDLVVMNIKSEYAHKYKPTNERTGR